MASKTNTNIGDYEYFRIKRKIGMKRNKRGEWVPEYKQFYGHSQKEAKEKYDKYMKYRRSASLNSASCFGEFVSWYTDNVFWISDDIKTKTKTIYVNAYHNVFDNSPVIGQRIEDITGADLQNVLSGSGSAAGTVRQALKFIRRFYKYLEAQNICNDLTRVLIAPASTPKKETQEIEIYTDKEIKAFIENMPKDHRLRLLVLLAIHTGARIAELLALKYEDIENGSIRINKSLSEIEKIKGSEDPDNKTLLLISDTKTPASVRTLPLSGAINEEVKRHKQWHRREQLKNGYRTDFVFTTSSGSFYYQSTLRKSFNRLCAAVRVTPRGFHAFRHTFGTRLAAGGVPIQTVSKLMGHSDISVTAKYYINISDNEKESAIAVLG